MDKSLLTWISGAVFSILMLCGSATAQQFDQPSTGANYTNFTYYRIADGMTESHAHTRWDIAFNTQLSSAGIIVNEAVGSSMGAALPAVELYLADANSFDDLDTVGMQRIYNQESSWEDGAFNIVGSPGNAFDLGWGTYNPANNQVSGTRFFVIKLRDGSFRKIEIQLLAGGVYTFRYANLDGSNEKAVSINKLDYPNSLFAYYSLEEEKALDLEPESWDLLFTRYVTPLPDGTGDTLDYILTGVLSREGVEVAQADDINPGTVDPADYEDAFTTRLDEIGFDWKSFDLNTFQWAIVPDRVYFVKTADQELWQLQFIDFEGSGTGVTTLQKTFLSTITSVQNSYQYLESWSLFPNPASDYVNVAIEASSAMGKEGSIRIIDQSGRLLQEEPIHFTAALTVQHMPLSLPSGQYFLVVELEGETITQKLIIP